MIATRVIPRLDIKGPHLVKGIHLEGLRVLGDPAEFARHYYEQGADELMYQDVVASLYERNSLHDIISRTASRIFIPITVGGGLRSLDDIARVLRAGADKVSLNTAAIRNPSLIFDAAKAFGSSTIVVSIEAIRGQDGNYFAHIDNGREETGREVCDWAREVADRGAGEIHLTSVDRDGTGIGYDTKLIRLVSDAVSIPVIAHGGAGKKEDGVEAVNEGRAHAICIASLLHYECMLQHRFEKNMKEGNTEFLRSGKIFSRISPCTLPEIKSELKREGIHVR